MSKIEYKPEICEHCGQTETYILGLDHGTVDIVRAIAKKIGEKGINIVHPRKENVLTNTQWCNIARPRFHGLIAAVKGKRGNFLLTKKGAAFLRGETVPRYAIVSKVEGHQIGYFEQENNKVTISDLLAKGEYWEGIGYDIVDGEVFHRVEDVRAEQRPLFA